MRTFYVKIPMLGVMLILIVSLGLASPIESDPADPGPGGDSCNGRFRVLPFAGPAQDGQSGFADGPLGQARFDTPTSLAPWGYRDLSGLYVQILFVSDSGNHALRMVVQMLDGDDSHIQVLDEWVETIAGLPKSPGFADGTRGQARFNRPMGISVDYANGWLYVADAGNNAIRRVDLWNNGATETLIGPDTTGVLDEMGMMVKLNEPTGVAWGMADGRPVLYIAERGNHCLRMLDLADSSQPVTTVAGTCGQLGSTDGDAKTEALFDEPTRLDWWPDLRRFRGSLFVTDRSGIRLVRDNRVTTILSDPVPSGKEPLTGIYADTGSNLYVANPTRNTIKLIPYDSGAETYRIPETQQLNPDGCGEALSLPFAITPFFGFGAVADTAHHTLRLVVPSSSDENQGNVIRRIGINERDARSPMGPRG